MRGGHSNLSSGLFEGYAKSPSAALRFTEKGLNVRKVRLALSRIARLAYEAFFEALTRIRPESRTSRKDWIAADATMTTMVVFLVLTLQLGKA